MSKERRWAIYFSVAAALVAALFQILATPPLGMETPGPMTTLPDGKSWITVYRDAEIMFYFLNADGVIQDSFSVPRSSGNETVQIPFIAADEGGRVYFIKHYAGAADGKIAGKQELSVYTPGILPFGRIKTARIDLEQDEKSEDIFYRHIHVSSSLVLTGASADGSRIYRKACDLESLQKKGSVAVKSEREYPAVQTQGVYKLGISGTDVIYISRTGRVFLSSESARQPVQIYPEGGLPASSAYASFIWSDGSGRAIIGEQSGGGIMRLFNDGRQEYINEGTQRLGALPYTGKDIVDASFDPANENTFVALAQNGETGKLELIVSNKGDISLIKNPRQSFGANILRFIGLWLLYCAALAALAAAIFGIRAFIAGSRTVFLKLIIASVPLLVLALVLFGVYSFSSYESALVATFETKVTDQGNLLRALFGSDSFDKITSPEMYNSTEYDYLRTYMGTRDVFTSSAYFVDMKLYTGVDSNNPCLYPFGVRRSESARNLYRAAALTGKQQAGVITDELGERIACVTPAGSSAGNVVFLLETSVFRAEVGRQTAGFIRNYLLIAGICILAAAALLLLMFISILRPLGDIADGLEKFSRGDRTVRLQSATNDELADICRVFNKMTGDIDVQLYRLQTMSDTYYRFVPQQIFRMLGKDNLGDIELGSSVEGKFCVLLANVYPREQEAGFPDMQELINKFFAIVHKSATDNGSTLIPDSSNLQELRVICRDADAAVRTAMAAIALIDSHNARSLISRRVDVSFFLHRAQMGFGICGDTERYIPAMLSSELEATAAACEPFRRLSSRLIVTGAAHGELDPAQYLYRFIGYAEENAERRTGLFDYYDSSSPSVIRLLNETKDTFDKAVGLFYQKRYYDAKNLFTIVLRENQYDNVARYYVFRCEKNL